MNQKNKQLEQTSFAPSAERSWAVSHLPAMTDEEMDAVMNLFNAWFENKQWTLPETCRRTLVWEYAERHGFSGMVGSMTLAGRIKDKKLGELGKQRYFTNLLQHEKCIKVCRDIQAKAIELNIPVVFFKGPTLDLSAFREPGIRSYADLDILIGSRKDAWRIIRALDYICEEGEEEDIFKNRFLESGRVHAFGNGWALEFCYPLDYSCDPMFDLLTRHKQKWLKVPGSVEELAMPDPELHLLLLIQHMSRHLCSQFIWFLDIVAFIKSNHESIDFTWIEKEMAQLQMSNITSLIFDFCNRFLDNKIPSLSSDKTGWNFRIQDEVISNKQFSSYYSMYHEGKWSRIFSYPLSPCRLYFITDPGYHAFYKESSASKWVASTLMHAFKLRNRLYYFSLRKLSQFLLVPFSFFIGLIASKGNRSKYSSIKPLQG